MFIPDNGPHLLQSTIPIERNPTWTAGYDFSAELPCFCTLCSGWVPSVSSGFSDGWDRPEDSWDYSFLQSMGEGELRW